MEVKRPLEMAHSLVGRNVAVELKQKEPFAHRVFEGTLRCVDEHFNVLLCEAVERNREDRIAPMQFIRGDIVKFIRVL